MRKLFRRVELNSGNVKGYRCEIRANKVQYWVGIIRELLVLLVKTNRISYNVMIYDHRLPYVRCLRFIGGFRAFDERGYDFHAQPQLHSCSGRAPITLYK